MQLLGEETTKSAQKAVFSVRVSSAGKSWIVNRNLEDFRLLDRQIHQCVYDRKFSNLHEIPDEENLQCNGNSVQVRNCPFLPPDGAR